MTLILDDELLAGFEARLRHVGAAVVDHWAPGLEDAHIDELVAGSAIELPDEARAWWRWHNGTVAGAPPTRTAIVPWRNQLPLDAAVSSAASFAAERVEIFDMPELARQLDLVDSLPSIYVDCNGPRDTAAPIYTQNDYTEPPQLVLPSMGELVATWMQLIDDGVFATAPDGQWQRPAVDRLAPEMRGRGIV